MNTYNGWANRETWLVNLHFGDYPEYFTDGATSRDDLANTLRDAVSESVQDAEDSIFGDYSLNTVSGFVRDLLPDMDSLIRDIDFDGLAESWLHGMEYCKECESWFDTLDHEGKFVTHIHESDENTYTCGDCANEEEWT